MSDPIRSRGQRRPAAPAPSSSTHRAARRSRSCRSSCRRRSPGRRCGRRTGAGSTSARSCTAARTAVRCPVSWERREADRDDQEGPGARTPGLLGGVDQEDRPRQRRRQVDDACEGLAVLASRSHQEGHDDRLVQQQRPAGQPFVLRDGDAARAGAVRRGAEGLPAVSAKDRYVAREPSATRVRRRDGTPTSSRRRRSPGRTTPSSTGSAPSPAVPAPGSPSRCTPGRGIAAPGWPAGWPGWSRRERA